MKISKKEKTIILVLLFVLVVGVFLMYGIIPASKELKEKQTKCNELQAEVNKLIRDYNAHDPSKKVNDIETILMEYYKSDSEDYVIVKESLNALLDFKPLLDNIVDSLVGSGYNANIHGKIDKQSIKTESFTFESTVLEQKSYSLLLAEAKIDFNVNNIDDVMSVIDMVVGKKDYQVRNFSLKYDAMGDYNYAGSFDITKYYIEAPVTIPQTLVDNYRPSNPVEDAPQIPYVNQMDKVLTFDTIPNAVSYDIYEVIFKVDDVGQTVFDKFSDRPVVSGLKAREGETTVEFNYNGKLDVNKKYVVTAVGNYKEYLFKDAPIGETVYFRTILTQELANDRKFSVN